MAGKRRSWGHPSASVYARVVSFVIGDGGRMCPFSRARGQEYIVSRRFPQKFSRRVLQQYKYHYKKISVLDNYAILESLPTTARTSLLFAQYHDAVDQLSFLQACCAVQGGRGGIRGGVGVRLGVLGKVAVLPRVKNSVC